jgi:hypothetical protein
MQKITLKINVLRKKQGDRRHVGKAPERRPETFSHGAATQARVRRETPKSAHLRD